MTKSSLFFIDPNSSLPKYRQLVNLVIIGIETEQLKKGDKIPSLNQICELNAMSRDTVMMAFNELKTRGVIISRPGKGYFIQNTQIEITQRIFVLFDELNSFKEDMYNSFLQHLDNNTDVDIFFHHFNFKLFSDLIENAVGNYTSYVIMPATFNNTAEVINQLPSEKVYILDRKKQDLSHLPSVYQDFKNDVFEALKANHEIIKKYEKIVLFHPGGKEPEERKTGFKAYVSFAKTKHEIVESVTNLNIEKNTLYLVPSDRSLVKLIKKADENELILGVDVGIISFNETVLKEVVAGGISTISTNFFEMGKTLANMIQAKSNQSIRNSWLFIKRKSV